MLIYNEIIIFDVKLRGEENYGKHERTGMVV